MTGPAYGQQPSFGAPRGAPAGSASYLPRPRKSEAFGMVGAGLAIIGAAVLGLAFTRLPWLRTDNGTPFLPAANSKTKFTDLHNSLEQAKLELEGSASAAKLVHFGIAPSYFSWLAWVLLLVSFVFAMLAVSPLRGLSTVFRVLGALIALAGVGATLWAIELVRLDSRLAAQLGTKSPSYLDYLKHGGLGFWAAVAGFVLIGLAALVGPRRADTTSHY
jgi:hypothetical protein